MKKEKQSKHKKWPWVLGAIILIIVVLGIRAYNQMEETKNRINYKTYTLENGDIVKSVTASGTLEADDTKDINVLNQIKINEVLVSKGNAVAAGQELASLDVETLQNLQATLYGQLDSLDRQLARLGGSKTSDTIYSLAKGRVKGIFVSKGDDVASAVASKGSLLVISTDGKMKTEIAEDGALSLKSNVIVALSDGSKKEGLVESVTAGGYIVTLDDNGPKLGDAVEIYDGDRLVGKGTLAVNAPITVIARGGTISRVHVDENDKVSVGTKLFTIEEEPFTAAYQQVYDDRTETTRKLEKIAVYLQDPFVRAEEEGMIGAVLVQDGQTLAASEMAPSDEQAAFTILTGGVTKLTVDMDELDIGQIKVDQTAQITADAITGETFEGKVIQISRIGDALNGITTFEVQLSVSKDDRLYAGMNAVATVIADRVENVILIPLELIEEDAQGEYVYITPGKKEDGSDKQRVQITTGLSDGIYAQVKTGLSGGDTVIYEDNEDQNIMMRMIQRSRDMGFSQ
ncbi:MAG: efflux RND transporter periplasmic adaptor subunit [Christensenellales bacterium]